MSKVDFMMNEKGRKKTYRLLNVSTIKRDTTTHYVPPDRIESLSKGLGLA